MIKNIGIEEQVRLWDGLQSYWNLNSTGGTTAYDSIGGRNGSCTSIDWNANGKNGYCALYNATTDVINCGSIFSYERTQAWTFSCWVKRVTINSTTFLFSKSLASGNYTGFGCYFKAGGSNKLSIALVGTSTSNKLEFDSTTVFTDTTNWYHIAITYDGSSTLAGFKLYVNGVEDTQTATTQALNTSIINIAAFQIGNRNSAASILGYMDEVAFWNRALRSDEAKMLYSGGNGKFYGVKAVQIGRPNRCIYFNSGMARTSDSTARGTPFNFGGKVDKSFTIAGWLKIPTWASTTYTEAFFGHGQEFSYMMRLYDSVATDSLFYYTASNNKKYDFVLDTWYFMFVTNNDSANESLWRVYKTTGLEFSQTLSSASNPISSADDYFYLGCSRGRTLWGSAQTSKMNAVGVWNTYQDSNFADALFNNGIGLSYADLSAGQKSGLVSWWDCDAYTPVTKIIVDKHSNAYDMVAYTDATTSVISI